jgi:tRNA(Ile)-lysidine synthase
MPAPRGLVQQIDQELHRSGLLPRGARLLVAVSGGADSVALLRLLHAVNGSDYWGWKLVVGHVEHGIRGRESRIDSRFVKRLAERLGMRCVMRSLKLGKRASEGMARAGRLRALEAMARRGKFAAVVMGHHAEDQAETVLLRLFRGCGIDGLGGMAADATVEGVRILRPLLGIRRADLRGYLKTIGQVWREDRTNATDLYMRNRMRARLLPEIERLAPGAIAAITRTAALAQQVQELIERKVDKVLAAALVAKKKHRVEFRRTALRKAAAIVCGEAVRWGIRQVGGSTETANYERLREAVGLIQGTSGGKQVQVGRGIVVRIGTQARGHVVIEQARGPR